MILYVCECGAKLKISDNTEASRAKKRAFKKKHDKKLVGHKWNRRKARKEES